MSLAFDPFDPAFLEDPYPWYRRLRDEAPLYHVEKRGYWVLTRYADVMAALRDHATYSSARGTSPEPGIQLGLIASDPPKHTRLRRIVQSVFTPRAIERQWAARVQKICDELLDAAVGAGPIDAYASLSLPLPVQVIAELLGIPDGDRTQFKRWSDDMCSGISQHIDPSVKSCTERAFSDLLSYFSAQARERRRAPGEDLLSLLCEAGDDERLTEKELVYFCILLLIAGNETTTNLIGTGLLALLEHPAEEAKLRANPALLPAAIDEMLRYGSPVQSAFRQTTREVEVHGRAIPAGARVMISVASANRDERHCPDADRLMVDRAPVESAAFGTGIHFCLGAWLARLEATTMFRGVLDRTSSLRAAGAPRFLSSVMMRGPTHLPIELVAR